jgi:hypothetical protein
MPENEQDNVRRIRDYQQTTDVPGPKATLKGGGGDGTYEVMEHRVAALEKGFERIEKKLDGLITDVSEIKGQLRAMPTTVQLLLAVVAIFTASGVLRYFGH